MEPLIQVRNLHYSYPDGTPALRGVDFELWPAETVAVLGANGSGKTTFLLHLLGLVGGKSEGDVVVRGLALRKENFTKIRRMIGMLFQDSDDQLFMPTVEEDVAFGPLNMGLAQDEVERRVRQSLRQVGMEHVASRPPYHLSAGEKRRVALAGVLAMSPEMILLDEPSTFLDPPARSSLVEILRSLPQAQCLVTHDLTLARQLASRAVYFEKGEITLQGGVEDVIARAGWETLDARRSDAPR
ncbi:MAG: ABC transporter ATP-binding protein [Acidobacteria bacterium]|nr:ABC transporter ATP-binding protein [Acidobacteriota bacterium]